MTGRIPLCSCGCGEPTSVARRTSRNTKKGYFNKFVEGHHGQKGKTRSTKIQKVYEVDEETGCWNWLLFKNKKGYGTWHNLGKSGRLAHRLMYEELVGPIPFGLTLDHLCGNKSCVNPEHMEPVTSSENSKRKEGTSTHCLSLNFIVIRVMNEWKNFCRSLKSQTTSLLPA